MANTNPTQATKTALPLRLADPALAEGEELRDLRPCHPACAWGYVLNGALLVSGPTRLRALTDGRAWAEACKPETLAAARRDFLARLEAL